MANPFGNMFGTPSDPQPSEITEVLLDTTSLRMERIISMGHTTPENEWYDQESHEWVLLLRGKASIQFEDPAETIQFGPGDFVNIPAHRRHRVNWTDPNEPTIWLAVFYSQE